MANTYMDRWVCIGDPMNYMEMVISTLTHSVKFTQTFDLSTL